MVTHRSSGVLSLSKLSVSDRDVASPQGGGHIDKAYARDYREH